MITADRGDPGCKARARDSGLDSNLISPRVLGCPLLRRILVGRGAASPAIGKRVWNGATRSITCRPAAAGTALTRERFIDAMEGIVNWDAGGVLPNVSFSATNHHAQRAGFICEMQDGRLVALTDWIAP